jgi:hypothetical protein
LDDPLKPGSVFKEFNKPNSSRAGIVIIEINLNIE